MNLETAIATVITAVLTYLGTKKQTEYQLKGKKFEAEAGTEGMYVQNMSIILAEYKDQVSGFRTELQQVRKEFAEFKEQHYKKIKEYEVYVEELEEENSSLKEELTEVKLEVSYLKGEINEEN